MIGAGIVTCNREGFFRNCINSIPKIDFLVVVNDGKAYGKSAYTSKPDIVIEHKKNKGVGISKNELLKTLMENSCDHIFLIEDDVFIKNLNVFEHYINTAERTGIYHLNFAFHGNENRNIKGEPLPRKIIVNNGVETLVLSKNLLGAFSYYHKSIIDRFGYIDERYKNGLEHVDHTYQIIKGGCHPPFWWFADAPGSPDFIEDQDKDHSKSIIRTKRLMWRYWTYQNIKIFRKKNGLTPFEIPDVEEAEVELSLKRIYDMYNRKS